MRRPTIPAVFRGTKGKILAAIAVGWFFSIGVRLVFPAILPQLTAEFELSLTAGGLLISLLYFVYGLGQFPGGILGDRYGDRRILLLSTGLAAAAVAVVVLSWSAYALATGFVAFGVATALFAPSRFAILSATFPEREGTAIGITFAAGNAGNTALPAVIGVLTGYIGWRYGLALTVPFFLLTLVLLYRYLPRGKQARRSDDETISFAVVRDLMGAMGNRRVLLVTVVLLFWNFTWQAFTGVYPTYLVVEKGVPGELAAVVFGSYFAVGMVLQPLTGALGDRFGHRWVLIGVFGLTIPGFLMLPLVDGLWGIVAITVLISCLLGASPVIYPLLIEGLPEHLQGSGLGFVRTGYMSLGASGPVIVSTAGDFGYFDQGFVFLGGCMAVAFCLAGLIRN